MSTNFYSLFSKRRKVNSCFVSRVKCLVKNKYVFSLHHQADACLCAKHTEILQTELSSQMKLVKETVKSKTAVPTTKVFVSVLVTTIMLLLLLCLIT